MADAFCDDPNIFAGINKVKSMGRKTRQMDLVMGIFWGYYEDIIYIYMYIYIIFEYIYI